MLEVITAAASQDLATLAELKAFLGVSGTAEDAVLQSNLTTASLAIAAELRRVVPAETVEETFWEAPKTLVLERSPLISITSVVEEDVTLGVSDYKAEVRTGILFRLSSSRLTDWSGHVVVRYVAGYSTIPLALKEAVFIAVKGYQEAEERDVGVKSERLEGSAEQSYFSLGGEWLSPEVLQRLAPYRMTRRL
jgi:uncharacterized phiE125 gp8 family phage protein